METVSEYVIEPEVAAPPPRAARLPLTTSLLIAAAMVLFGLILFGGSRALWEDLKLGWLTVAGHTVTARIVSIQTAPPLRPGRPPRQVGLVYHLPGPNGTVRAGSVHLNAAATAITGGGLAVPGAPAPPRSYLPVFHVGGPLRLRLAPWPGGPLRYPWSPAPWGKMVFLTFAGSLVVGVSLGLLRRLLRWRGERLRLLRFGVATVGTIVDKRLQVEDTPRYFVRYGYARQPDGAPCEQEEQCSPGQWKRLEIGQSVTVLYDPARPAGAALYGLMRSP